MIAAKHIGGWACLVLSCVAGCRSGEDPELERRLAWKVRKLETEYYYEVHLHRRLGYARDRLRGCYDRDSATFRDGLGRVLPFADAEPEVADSLAIREAGRRFSVGVTGLPAARIPACADTGSGRKCLSDFRREISGNAFRDLAAKYRVRNSRAGPGADSAGVCAYYEKHRDRYFTPRAFDVSHLELASRVDAEKAAAGLRRGRDFAASARASSLNAWTGPRGGVVGAVKEGHGLPYGIGFMPEVFFHLDSLPVGACTAPIANPATGRWHVFRLHRRIAPSLKPFERVKAVVEEDYLESRWTRQPGRRPLVGLPGGDTIRLEDVAVLRQELRVSESDPEGPTQEKAVELLTLWALGSLEIRALGLDREAVLQARVRKGTLDFRSALLEEGAGGKRASVGSTASGRPRYQ